MRAIAFVLIFLSINSTAISQIVQQNLNIYSGLPSNLVYSVTIDKNGYLWFCTDKGLAMYNGYNVKVFNVSNSLYNEDIWRLFEDKKGRKWPIGNSNHVGYIADNNTYKNIFYSDKTISPRDFCNFRDGIAFCNNGLDKHVIYIERNDTLKAYYFKDCISKINFSDTLLSGKEVYICNKGYIILINPIYPYDIWKFIFQNDSLLLLNSSYIHAGKGGFLKNKSCTYQHYLITYNAGEKGLHAIDFDNGICKEIILNNNKSIQEKIYHSDFQDNNLVLFSEKHVYVLDTLLRVKNVYNIDSLFENKKMNGWKISCLINDPFWGSCISTYSYGAFIDQNSEKHFDKANLPDLTDFHALGPISDTVSYWWSGLANTIMKVEKNKKTVCYHYKTVMKGDMQKIVLYNKDTAIIVALDNIYWFNTHSFSLSSMFTTKIKENIDISSLRLKTQHNDGTDIVLKNAQSFYVISKYSGWFQVKFFTSSGQLCDSITSLDNDRYNGLAYDSLKGLVLAYSNNKIEILNERNNQLVIYKQPALEKLGIHNIRKILVDSYGNVFIHQNDKLLLCDLQKGKTVQLFNNYVLNNNSVLFLNKNTLIAAGSFGVLFSKILEHGVLSRPFCYTNSRSANYNYVWDAEVNGNSVLLKTDRGNYVTSIPAESLLLRTFSTYSKYKFLIAYNGSFYNVSDTICVDQKNTSLQFDVINPMGNGSIKYSYRIGADTIWKELNANELTLHSIKANSSYTLSLIASDNVWQTPILNIPIYVVPYWWQTSKWEITFVILALFFSGVMTTLIVYLTKKIVKRKNEKKNLQLELELKSVYAQINPHFISNSLTAAMYFIKLKKLDAAYSHIYKFSHLLRAYIKSSQNRFIIIAEEVKNLRNYIELEQNRFPNKFDYSIILDPLLSLDTLIPSLLVQPFVENAIKHGLLHLPANGNLSIEFKRENKNELLCIIDDNGIGRKQSAAIRSDDEYKESYGDKLINNLIDVFNHYENIFITLQYIDKESPLQGTTVILRLKNKDNG